MDGKTLMAAMSYPGYPAPLSLARYTELARPFSTALAQANCNTVERVSMAAAQVGAESGSLRWTHELASGQDYDRYLNPGGPWRQLGNTRAGDGERFKGQGVLQITGRHHFTEISKWGDAHGYCPTSTYFLDHPALLGSDQYAFLGFVYYWTVARNMNRYADARDIRGGTKAVNGGYNNLSGRTKRWTKCLSIGPALLPAAAAPITAPKEPDMATLVLVDKKDCAKHGKKWPGYFLDTGDMSPRHIATVAELRIRRKQGLKTVKLTLAEYRAIGGK